MAKNQQNTEHFKVQLYEENSKMYTINISQECDKNHKSTECRNVEVYGAIRNCGLNFGAKCSTNDFNTKDLEVQSYKDDSKT